MHNLTNANQYKEYNKGSYFVILDGHLLAVSLPRINLLARLLNLL